MIWILDSLKYIDTDKNKIIEINLLLLLLFIYLIFLICFYCYFYC